MSRCNIVIVLGVLAPSVLLLVADFVVGDRRLFRLINQELANPVPDFACAYLSPVLFAVFYVITLVALYLSTSDISRAVAILSVVNGTASYGIGSLIKIIAVRPRPEALATARVIGIWNTSTFSFPSTLTMLAFGLTLPIFLEKRRAGVILVGLSYLMGFAVIYTGYHFPMDVAAGIIFASALSLCILRMKKPLARLIRRRQPNLLEEGQLINSALSPTHLSRERPTCEIEQTAKERNERRT